MLGKELPQAPELCQEGIDPGSLQSPGIRGQGKRLKR